ncbi:hypothetical protein Hanom_Chr01g00029761 [Helianthus anomalus]
METLFLRVCTQTCCFCVCLSCYFSKGGWVWVWGWEFCDMFAGGYGAKAGVNMIPCFCWILGLSGWAGGIRGRRVEPSFSYSWCYMVACFLSLFFWTIGIIFLNQPCASCLILSGRHLEGLGIFCARDMHTNPGDIRTERLGEMFFRWHPYLILIPKSDPILHCFWPTNHLMFCFCYRGKLGILGWDRLHRKNSRLMSLGLLLHLVAAIVPMLMYSGLGHLCKMWVKSWSHQCSYLANGPCFLLLMFGLHHLRESGKYHGRYTPSCLSNNCTLSVRITTYFQLLVQFLFGDHWDFNKLLVREYLRLLVLYPLVHLVTVKVSLRMHLNLGFMYKLWAKRWPHQCVSLVIGPCMLALLFIVADVINWKVCPGVSQMWREQKFAATRFDQYDCCCSRRKMIKNATRSLKTSKIIRVACHAVCLLFITKAKLQYIFKMSRGNMVSTADDTTKTCRFNMVGCYVVCFSTQVLVIRDWRFRASVLRLVSFKWRRFCCSIPDVPEVGYRACYAQICYLRFCWLASSLSEVVLRVCKYWVWLANIRIWLCGIGHWNLLLAASWAADFLALSIGIFKGHGAYANSLGLTYKWLWKGHYLNGNDCWVCVLKAQLWVLYILSGPGNRPNGVPCCWCLGPGSVMVLKAHARVILFRHGSMGWLYECTLGLIRCHRLWWIMPRFYRHFCKGLHQSGLDFIASVVSGNTRYFCTPKSGRMISYFWSPKYVSGMLRGYAPLML